MKQRAASIHSRGFGHRIAPNRHQMKSNDIRGVFAMTIAPPLRRLLALTTAIGMVMPSMPAAAQDDAGAPPGRVGQISEVSGSVSFNGAGTGGWAAATVNYPVSAGDSLYTQEGAQAAIALDESTVILNEATELQITGLTEDNLGATESQGEIFLDIDDLQPGETFTVATPRGSVTIGQAGKYDIDAGDANTPTVVTAFYGAATVTAPGASVQVAAGQSAVLSGTDQTTAQLGQADPDEFAQRELALTMAPPPSYAPQAVTEMTGAYELSQYGTWDQDEEYGAIWYPNVGPDWAPYREGYWANVPPWGWTWVDNEPWGFAPFHYGRWIDHGGRWGWIAADQGGGYGQGYRPIYAPAVVSFFGLAAGLTAAALASHSVGWVPLGPGEPFRPYYHTTPDYDRRINMLNVRNAGDVNFKDTRVDPSHFANRRGATYIPAEAMSHGDPVARFGHPVGATMLAGARTAGGADFRLPPQSAPLAHVHPGAAPRQTGFAARNGVPPVVARAPGEIHPGFVAPPQPGFGGPQNHPVFGANPGYHAPPPPPGVEVISPGHTFAPYAAPGRPQAPPRVFTPGIGQTETYPGQPPRQTLPQVYRPQATPMQVYHPQGAPANLPQVYHPEIAPAPPAYRPPPQVFHPEQAPVFRPPQPVFHPETAPQQEMHVPAMQPQHFAPPPAPRPLPPAGQGPGRQLQ
jgi:hypothetical protein